MKASEDADMVAKAATEALTQPQYYLNYDRETQYGTHGVVAIWEDRGGDLVAESNYRVMLRELEAVAEDPDDVLNRSASHFLYGSLRTIFVRVYRGGWTAETVPEDIADTGDYYTTAFLRAVDLAASLIDCPFLDEDDHSELESEVWESVLDDAIDQARQDYDDSIAEDVMFHDQLVNGHRACPGSNMIEYFDRCDRYSHGESDPSEVDYDVVAEWYTKVRNEHFEWLAARHWAAIQEARHVNDVPLF